MTLTLKPVYRAEIEPDYRAECDVCDWWETTMEFRDVRTLARLHMADENLRPGHESAEVTIWKVQGRTINEYGA